MSYEPRNGHIIVRKIEPEGVTVFLPDGATRDDIKIVIVAIAPDVPLNKTNNQPLYRVGDAVIGLPGANLIGFPGSDDLGVCHYSAILAIERS